MRVFAPLLLVGAASALPEVLTALAAASELDVCGSRPCADLAMQLLHNPCFANKQDQSKLEVFLVAFFPKLFVKLYYPTVDLGAALDAACSPCTEAAGDVAQLCLDGVRGNFSLTAECVYENYDELRVGCPQLPSNESPFLVAAAQCLVSVPGVIAAGQECVAKLSDTSDTILTACPSACFEFSKALVSNGCTSGNSSLVAMFAPETYELLLEIESEIDELAAYCGCFPWETPPTKEDLQDCAADILAGLTERTDFLGQRVLELPGSFATRCTFVSPPHPSCPFEKPELPNIIEPLRECLVLASTIVEKGLSCYAQLQRDSFPLKVLDLAHYLAGGSCPEDCAEFAYAASVFATDHLEGSGSCNTTLELAGYTFGIGETGTAILEALAFFNGELSDMMAENSCGECTEHVAVLATQDIPNCLKAWVNATGAESECTLSPSHGKCPTPTIVDECAATVQTLSQAAVECKESIASYTEPDGAAAVEGLSDLVELGYELATCPGGCVDLIKTYTTTSCQLGQLVTGVDLKALVAEAVETLPCENVCYEVTISAIEAELLTCTDDPVACGLNVAALLGSSPCPLPAGVQECAMYITDISESASRCPAVAPAVAAISAKLASRSSPPPPSPLA